MRTKIKARKNTVIKWIENKFGSLELLANVAGIDTSIPQVRDLLAQVRTSRDPVVLSIKWRNAVIEFAIEHSATSAPTPSPLADDILSIAKENVQEGNDFDGR